jgi:hypothetical protein
MQFGFASGSAWAIDSAANPTPSPFGILQDVSVDFSFSNKELTGQYGFPVAVGRGTGKISCKAKAARLSGRLLNLFFGGTKATGQTSVAQDELGTIPTTPFQVTVANSAFFATDLGVYDSATSIPFVRVASAPAAGQYSVVAGVYTFNTADTGKTVKISYTYTIAGTGESITIANQLMGTAPTFKAVATQIFNNLRSTLTLNSNVFSKLGAATKLEDFNIPEFDWSTQADAANNIGTWSLAEAS